MASRSNNALDYSRFGAENPVREPQKKRNNVIRMPKQERSMAGSEKKLNIRQILKYTALSVVAIAIIGTVLMNKVRINELGSNLSAEQAKLQEAEQKYSQLSMEARAKVNIRDVEAYAVNELGMQLPEGYQVETISLSEGDKTVIHQDEGTDDGQDMTKEWSEIKIAATNILAYLD